MEAKQNTLKIGIAGLGGHGGNIQRSADISDRVEVVAVCDPNTEELAKSVERFSCPGFATYNEMLASGDMDAVVLVTPNQLHREQVLAAFDRGLHVMVEKPIANTVADGLDMVEAARAADRILYVAHNMRFSRVYDRVREYVDSGRLGEIVAVEIHFSAANTRWLPKESWRLDPALCPMMPVMQLGVHGIDVVQSFIGPVASVASYAEAFTTPPEVIDAVTGGLRFESGALGTIVSTYCTQVAFDFRLSGTEGTVFATPHRGWFRRVVDTDSHCEGPTEDFNFLEYHSESFERQMDAFGGMVLDGTWSGATPADALRALAVVEALEESAKTGSRSSVQQFSEAGALV